MDINQKFFKYLIYYPVVFLKGMNVPKYLKEYKRIQYFSSEELNTIQLIKLRKLIRYAKKYVPYYQSALNNFSELDLKQINDIQLLTYLTKDVLKKDHSKVLSNERFFNLTKKTTAGSTGEPFILWKSSKANACELSATWRGYSWAGIDIGDRQGRFWGVPLIKNDIQKSKLIDFVTNRMRCSAFSFNKEKMIEYTKKLSIFKPKYFYGYLSMLTQYAKHFQNTDTIPPFDLKCIITTSEILTPSDRNLLEDVFNTKVFNEYGCAEVGTIAHECDNGTLHISAENMILEILDGNRICAPGETGEIVITELNNKVMPLIRYRTGDLGALSVSDCKCGCNLPVLENIKGRAWDMIKHKDGRMFHPAFFLYIFEEAKDKNLGIGHYKIFQENYCRFRILIVPEKNYSQKAEEFIRDKMKREFDESTIVEFELVEFIEREASGKLRQMVGLNSK